jgi:hypothetical protein
VTFDIFIWLCYLSQAHSISFHYLLAFIMVSGLVGNFFIRIIHKISFLGISAFVCSYFKLSFLPLYLLMSYFRGTISFCMLISCTSNSLNFLCSNCSGIRLGAKIDVFNHFRKYLNASCFEYVCVILRLRMTWILPYFHFSMYVDWS